MHYHAIEKHVHYGELHSFDAFILSFWRLEANSMSFGNLCKFICLVCMDKSSFSYRRLQRNMNMKGEMISCKIWYGQHHLSNATKITFTDIKIFTSIYFHSFYLITDICSIGYISRLLRRPFVSVPLRCYI